MKISYLFLFIIATAIQVCVVSAQSFTTSTQIQQQIGKTIAVIDNSGEKVHGTLSKISESHLEITANGKTYAFTPSDLREVRKHENDSLLNGTLIGAGIGAGVALGVIAGSCSTEECNDGEKVGFTALFSGIGAGVGLGLDSMTKQEIAVYQRPQLSMRISPQLGIRKGVHVSLQF